MAKNYNIQTECRQLAQNASDNIDIGSQVPAGMTRYVTFIDVTPMDTTCDEGSKVFICSAASAGNATTDALASVAQKMVIQIASASAGNQEVMLPPAGPDTEHPLFTVASAGYLQAHLACAATMSASVTLFVQYYDE